MKYDVPVPTDVSLLKKSSGKTTFPVAFPIQETRARRAVYYVEISIRRESEGPWGSWWSS